MTQDRAHALPEGYSLRRGRRGVLVARGDLLEPLVAAGFGPDTGEAPLSRDLSGRGRLGELTVGTEHLVVRRYLHGGLLRWLTGSRFADPGRPLHELGLSLRLVRAGIPTPAVLATRTQRAPGFGFRLELVTQRIPDAQEMAEWLEAIRVGEVGLPERTRVLEAAGELVGRLHAVGFLHADLHPRNLLLTAEGAPVVIDLDRSRFAECLTNEQRRSNLRRFLRSILRRQARGQAFVRLTDYRRFFKGYERGWGGEVSWRGDWHAIERASRQHRLWHRLGWLAEGGLGGGDAARDGRAAVRS